MASDLAFIHAAAGAPSPRRREHLQPPALTTSLSRGQHLHGPLSAQTPASTTSLVSPFSAYDPASFSDSPSSALRGTSPMPSRNSMAFAGPYNPQEWGPTAGRQSMIGVGHNAQMRQGGHIRPTVVSTREASGMEEITASPPPPYSPQRPQHGESSTSTGLVPGPTSQAVSSAGTPAHYRVSMAASATTGTPSSSYNRASRPVSMFQPSSSPHQPPPSFPPPPSQSPPGARSSSRSRSDRTQPLFSLSALTSRARPQQQNAIETLQHQTADALARPHNNPRSSTIGIGGVINSSTVHAVDQWTEEPLRPPASRRAVSTGAIGLHGGPSRVRSDSVSPSQVAWQPGMPLPPPPPGPPPNARSHSMSRPQLDTASTISVPTRAPPTRRPPGHGTALGPVPPTPADWVEGNGFPEPNGQSSFSTELAATSPSFDSREPGHSPSNGFGSPRSPSRSNLVRMPARREPSAKGIRERRSESRADSRRRSYMAGDLDSPSGLEDLEPVKPADLVLPMTNGSTLMRRRTIAKSTPRTPKAFSSPYEGLDSARSRAESEPIESIESAHSTPRPGSSRHLLSSETFAPTPPFSPGHDRFADHAKAMRPSPPLPPKSLPTPPPQQSSASSGLMSPSYKPEVPRPVSHILHSPLTDPAMPSPLVPERATAASSTNKNEPPENPESFKRAAVERHHLFAEREALASSDRERIELFAEYIIAESSLRKEKYAEAIQNLGARIHEMTKDLFKSTPQNSVAYTSFRPEDDQHLLGSDRRLSGHNGSLTAAVKGLSSSIEASPEDYEPPARASLKLNTQARPDSTWWNGYMPSLSPIASMGGTSGTPDEMSSRGRPASRWWEASQEGSTNGDGTKRVHRSKRESKYMGLPREVRESLQWDAEPSPSGGLASASTAEHNGQFPYGPNEYPPEKSGWHEQALDDGFPPPPPHPPPSSSPYSASTVSRPDSKKLDVSRLVTLPPPYPRHHPAVNNNHPDLASIRTVIRSLSDLEDVRTTKERYFAHIELLRDQARQEANHRRSKLVADIQRQIQAGEMTYAEAARHEAELETVELQRKKDLAQHEFDLFQSDVIKPLESLFSERIDRATATISELQGILFIDAQESSPNMTQEEGDEQPELLEKLTQLKWLFEAREQLHREQEDLSRERTDKYKSVVTTPYMLPNSNPSKLREAEAFFAHDALDRKLAFDQASLARFEDFLHVIESNVVRGVEQQLSAFWDIAPSLSAVIEQIPEDNNGLHTLDILIPPAELDENPSYRTFPLLYLHSLLDHAHRSTYQFIESQTNLLCLLHEVKSAVMLSVARLTETRRIRDGDDPKTAAAEATLDREREEARITDDLKEKVRVVEALWDEGLGKELSALRERVKEWLVEVGGWEDADD